MKILITGGAGFIGSNLVKGLDAHDVSVWDKDKYQFDYWKHDYDAIVHLAAISDTTFKPDNTLIKTNFNLFYDILKFARKINATLVYASSAAVYGNGPAPMVESQELQPLNAYAVSKAIIDGLASCVTDLTIVGLRYFNVYGQGEVRKGKSASMVWQLREQIKSDNSVKLFAWGDQKRDFVYIQDVISATINALKAKKSGIYNVGSGVATSFNRLHTIINRVLGVDTEAFYCSNPYEKTYQIHTQADLNLINRELKWQPEWELEKGIKDYFEKE